MKVLPLLVLALVSKWFLKQLNGHSQPKGNRKQILLRFWEPPSFLLDG